MFEKKNVLGVGITDVTKEEILEFIIRGLGNQGEKYFIVTPNPEILVLADNDHEYRSILNDAKIALADGMGVVLASRFLGRGLKGRVTGIDLLESICQGVSEKPITVGFLGGGPKVAEMAAECLEKKYPGLKVVFAAPELDKVSSKRLSESTFGIDMLFVAFGAPKQEIWMSKNLRNIPARVAMGVGGAFDYISSKVGRAPCIDLCVSRGASNVSCL